MLLHVALTAVLLSHVEQFGNEYDVMLRLQFGAICSSHVQSQIAGPGSSKPSSSVGPADGYSGVQLGSSASVGRRAMTVGPNHPSSTGAPQVLPPQAGSPVSLLSTSVVAEVSVGDDEVPWVPLVSAVVVDGSVVVALDVEGSVVASVAVGSTAGDLDSQPGKKARAPVKNGRVWIK
jgi:hypothetical protein